VVTDEITTLAKKWESLIKALGFCVVNAVNQKAITENEYVTEVERMKCCSGKLYLIIYLFFVQYSFLYLFT
jgi:hypothetical protein